MWFRVTKNTEQKYLLERIVELKNAYIAALAEEMKIAKDPVSPAAKRLGRKGLIKKAVAPDNKSINILHLTE